MTKSRKLFLAAALLAGGYGLALVLSGFTDFVRPQANSQSVAGQGWLPTLRGLVARRDPTPHGGQLVPESELRARGVDRAAVASGLPGDQPTWLAATPPPSSAPSTVGPPTFAVAPMPSDDQPRPPSLIPRQEFRELPEASPVPSARITNAVGIGGNSASSSASPWHGWPPWESKSSNGSERAVTALHRNLEPVRPQASQASFGAPEPLRGNQAPMQDETEERGEFLGQRTHVVVDGDSLEKLADRYLDDPELDEEIYRLNRDILTSPDLLPIGVELRIPDGRMAESRRAVAPASMGSGETPRVPAGMVPVQWTPRELDQVPRAQLLRPVPAGGRD